MAVTIITKLLVRGFHTTLILAVSLSLLYHKTSYLHSWIFDSPESSWPQVTCYWLVLVTGLVLYHLACSINPGYVDLPPEPNYAINSSDSEGNESENDKMLQTETADEALRKCGYCNITAPLRARHCADCGRCVRRYDHHCPWLAACVGERNHRLFWAFLLATDVIIVWTLFIAWYSFHIDRTDWLGSLRAAWLPLLNFIICLISAFPVSGLLAFHTYLALSNQTTWELAARPRITYLRKLPSSHNPFHSGYCRNCIQFLCSPRKGEQTYAMYKRSSSDQALV